MMLFLSISLLGVAAIVPTSAQAMILGGGSQAHARGALATAAFIGGAARRATEMGVVGASGTIAAGAAAAAYGARHVAALDAPTNTPAGPVGGAESSALGRGARATGYAAGALVSAAAQVAGHRLSGRYRTGSATWSVAEQIRGREP